MRTKDNKKTRNGISLIVLVITIVVIIILAAAVILTLNNNNPIDNAKKATFQNDLQTYKNDLNLNLSSRYIADNGSVNIEGIDAQNEEMNEYIQNVKQGYYQYIKIESGKLVVKQNASEPNKTWGLEVLNETGTEFSKNGNTTAKVAYVNAPKLTTGLTPIKFGRRWNCY